LFSEQVSKTVVTPIINFAFGEFDTKEVCLRWFNVQYLTLFAVRLPLALLLLGHCRFSHRPDLNSDYELQCRSIPLARLRP
jgi:hypothetical protein